MEERFREESKRDGEIREKQGGVRSWVRDMFISLIVSAFIIVFLYQPVRVEGTSMLPMLEDQDRLFINKMAYRVGEIHYGDVVVFLYPMITRRATSNGSLRCRVITSGSTMARCTLTGSGFLSRTFHPATRTIAPRERS